MSQASTTSPDAWVPAASECVGAPTSCGAFERGASSLLSMVCALVMLVAVLTSTQVLVALQRRSVIRAVALDAVSDVARERSTSRSSETDDIQRRFGTRTRVVWSDSGPDVVLRVTYSMRPIVAVGAFSRLSRIDVRVSARREFLIG